METAVQDVIKFLGMTVCDNSDRVNLTEKVHNLLLAGMFMSKDNNPMFMVCRRYRMALPNLLVLITWISNQITLMTLTAGC